MRSAAGSGGGGRGRRRSAPAVGFPRDCTGLSPVYAASIGAVRSELLPELVQEALQGCCRAWQGLPAAPTGEAASIAHQARLQRLRGLSHYCTTAALTSCSARELGPGRQNMKDEIPRSAVVTAAGQRRDTINPRAACILFGQPSIASGWCTWQPRRHAETDFAGTPVLATHSSATPHSSSTISPRGLR